MEYHYWGITLLKLILLLLPKNFTTPYSFCNKTKPLLYPYYSICFSLGQSFNGNEKLKIFYRILSTNTDGQTEFVSTVEGENVCDLLIRLLLFYDWISKESLFSVHTCTAYDFPIYATQWHPEKNAFEWTHTYIPHSTAAVRTTFYMAQFFVKEGMKRFKVHHLKYDAVDLL